MSNGRVDRGVYVRFSGKIRVFYCFSFSAIFLSYLNKRHKKYSNQGLMKKYVKYALKFIWDDTTKSKKFTGMAYIVSLSVRGSSLNVRILRPSYV